MDHATLVRACQSGTNLLEIEKSLLQRERRPSGEGCHIPAGEVLEHDIMKRSSGEIDCSAVAQTVDDIRMTNAIKGYGLVLKVCNQSLLQLRIGRVVQKHIERLDHHRRWSAGRRDVVTRNINFRVTATAQTFKNVVTTVEPGLL